MNGTKRVRAKNPMVYFNHFGKMKVGTQSAASGFKSVNKVQTRTSIFFLLFAFLLSFIACCSRLCWLCSNIEHETKSQATSCTCIMLKFIKPSLNWKLILRLETTIFPVEWYVFSLPFSLSLHTGELLFTIDFWVWSARCWYTVPCEWDRWHYNL